MKPRLSILSALLITTFALSASAEKRATTRAELPIRAAMAHAHPKMRKIVRYQMQKIAEQKSGQTGDFMRINGAVRAVYWGNQRTAELAALGHVATASSAARDGQSWLRMAEYDLGRLVEERIHGFRVGARNRALKKLGFQVGEKVKVRTRYWDGEPIWRKAEAVRFDEATGYEHLSVLLPLKKK